MTYSDLLDIALQRARRLKLGDMVVNELEAAMYDTLVWLAGIYDLDAFIILDDAMYLTSTNQETYPLPSNFGRLLHPVKPNSSGDALSGLYVYDGTSLLPLTYKHPLEWNDLDRTTDGAGAPSTFTIMGRTLYLNPLPDANGTMAYRGRGQYIASIEPFELDDEVLLDHPHVLVSETLFKLAGDTPDMPANTLTLLGREATRDLSALVNDQARTRQEYYRRSQVGRR